MEKKIFSNYRYLKREYAALDERCKTLARKLKYEKNEQAREQLDSLSRILEARKERVLCEEQRIQKLIDDIPDSLTRLVFFLRYVEGMSWQMVATRAGYATADSLRVMHERYLKQSEGGDMCDVS